jgi:outer membrane receptor protein involved in Fe transport
MSYGLSHSGDQPLQATFDRGNGKYQDRVDSLSTDFRTQYISQRATLNLQGKTGRLSYTLGGDWLGYSYYQRDLIADSTIRLHYFNWAPRLLINYNLNKATFIRIDYTASTTQPSIQQLTPTKNNNNPLFITLGNPELKPGFRQNFRLDIHHFRSWLVDLNVTGALVSNGISTKTITDSLGRQVSQPVNVDGGRTGGVNFSLGRTVLGFNASMHLAGTYSRSASYVNADLSRNEAYTGGGGFSLNKYVADQYSVGFNSNFTYFDQVSSINTGAPVHYWTQSHIGAVTLYFIKDFEINTNAVYTWQEKTSAFSASTSVLQWNAYVSRNLLNAKWVVRFQVNNMLDANAGISRANTGNSNTQSSTNIPGRYLMISAIYHFDKQFRKK